MADPELLSLPDDIALADTHLKEILTQIEPAKPGVVGDLQEAPDEFEREPLGRPVKRHDHLGCGREDGE